MANEIFGAPGAVLYAKIETAYNTDPTISAGDRVFVSEVDFDSYQVEMIDRPGLSAHRPGFRKVAGKVSAPFGLTTELAHAAVNGTTPTPPACDWALRMCGFSRNATSNTDFTSANVAAVAGTNDEIITYTLDDRIGNAGTSARLEYTEPVEGDTEGLKWTISGARADWVLTISAGAIITLALTGMGIGAEPAKVSTPTLTDTLPATARPMMGQGFVGIAFYDLAGDVVYGGGTPTAPTMGSSATVCLLSAVFSGNLNLQEDMCLSAAGAVARVRQRPDGPWTAELVLEQVVWSDDFDLYEFMTSGQPFGLTLCLKDPSTPAGAGANYWELACTCVATAVAKGDEGSRRVVTVTVAGAYPEASADGGGYKPANSLAMRWATIVAV